MANALAGVGSSINVNSLVSQLMAVERAPIDRVTAKTSTYQGTITALGTLKGSLSSLQTAAKALSDPGGASPVSVASSTASVATASASGGASPGSYALNVTSLAQAHRLYSGSYAATNSTVGAGTLTIERGTTGASGFTPNAGTTAVTVTIDPGKTSLAEVRDAINKANAGVTASIINDGSGNRLVMTSNDTGAANSLRITATDADGADTDAAGLSALAWDPAATGGAVRNMTEARAAADAVFSIDGLPVTRASNSVGDLVSGVSFSLLAAGSTTVTVSRDATAGRKAVDAFVSAFNYTSGTLKSLSAYDTTTKTGSPLFGESVVRTTQSQMRATVNTPYGEAGAAYQTLSSIGIGVNPAGQLAVTSSRFDAAVAADPAGVSKLLAAAGKSLYDKLAGTLAEGGSIDSRTSGIQANIKRLGDQQTRLEDRMSSIEARYRNQFAALDKAMSSMTATQSYLTSQFNRSSSTG